MFKSWKRTGLLTLPVVALLVAAGIYFTRSQSPAETPTATAVADTAGTTEGVSTPATASAKSVATPEPGGAYTEGVAGAPQAINPLLCQYNDVDRDLSSLIFEGLTTFDEHGLIVPRLASGWKISDDGLTYTFTLRSDVLWHDGAPLTSDDVIFTVGVMSNPDFLQMDASGLFDLWSSVQTSKVDDHTVQFVLAEPYAPFLDYTTIGLLPAHLLSKIEVRQLPQAQFNAHPVGTGSFMIEKSNAQQVMLKPFAEYYGAKPRLEHVIFQFYPDAESLFAAHARGEIDGISRVVPDQLSKVRDDHSLQLYSARLAKYTMILLNLADPELPFFQQTEMRQALLCGLDREAIVTRVLAGQGQVAHSPMIPDSWAYDPDVPQYAYDAGKAGQLLDGAGWVDADGDGTREKEGRRLQFTLAVSDDATWMRVAQEAARQWAEIGVQAQVEQVAFPQLVGEYLYPHHFEAILIAPEFAGDPDPYPFWHSTQTGENGQNWGGFSNRRADEVMEQARMTTDITMRTQLYREFQTIFAEQVPAFLLYYPIYSYAIDSRVQDAQVAPMNNPSDRFRTIANWYIQGRKQVIGGSSDADN